jgi:hypothetical protein
MKRFQIYTVPSYRWVTQYSAHGIMLRSVYVIEIDPVEHATRRLQEKRTDVTHINSKLVKRRWLIDRFCYLGKQGNSKGNAAIARAAQLVAKLERGESYEQFEHEGHAQRSFDERLVGKKA